MDKIARRGAKLVVTVDCGSGSEETIAALKERGIETVVTDHHISQQKDAILANS